MSWRNIRGPARRRGLPRARVAIGGGRGGGAALRAERSGLLTSPHAPRSQADRRARRPSHVASTRRAAARRAQAVHAPLWPRWRPSPRQARPDARLWQRKRRSRRAQPAHRRRLRRRRAWRVGLGRRHPSRGTTCAERSAGRVRHGVSPPRGTGRRAAGRGWYAAVVARPSCARTGRASTCAAARYCSALSFCVLRLVFKLLPRAKSCSILRVERGQEGQPGAKISIAKTAPGRFAARRCATNAAGRDEKFSARHGKAEPWTPHTRAPRRIPATLPLR